MHLILVESSCLMLVVPLADLCLPVDPSANIFDWLWCFFSYSVFLFLKPFIFHFLFACLPSAKKITLFVVPHFFVVLCCYVCTKRHIIIIRIVMHCRLRLIYEWRDSVSTHTLVGSVLFVPFPLIFGYFMCFRLSSYAYLYFTRLVYFLRLFFLLWFTLPGSTAAFNSFSSLCCATLEHHMQPLSSVSNSVEISSIAAVVATTTSQPFLYLLKDQPSVNLYVFFFPLVVELCSAVEEIIHGIALASPLLLSFFIASSLSFLLCCSCSWMAVVIGSIVVGR